MMPVFECGRAHEDYIYRDEIAETQAALGGKLRVVTTFSRQPNQPRVYVQERIGEVGDDVVRLLEEGLICMCVGEATRRAKEWEEVGAQNINRRTMVLCIANLMPFSLVFFCFSLLLGLNRSTMSRPTFKNHLIFDPWNSASSGHQHARSPGTNNPHWQHVREQRLADQFRPHTKASSREQGEWVWTHEDQPRIPGQRDIRSMFKVNKGESTLPQTDSKPTPEPRPQLQSQTPSLKPSKRPEPVSQAQAKQIFQGTTVYLNAPSHPLLSDHKLKHLLVTHGAAISLALTRRVTHVLVGKPNAGAGKGCGGGLAAGKLQREIARAGSRAVKVVFVDWVVESVKAEKRLAESRFAMHVAAQGQKALSFSRQ
ncbi:BRCA1 C Terminus (BRCT)-domain-containing protein [Aspergillus terreus]|uniref:BRCA1 C Terminus (BRCT)-domain-containing protein n=1 Tax=Aspergillus terreus TaxID=33178 RepID=A0A5M3ZC64_ASPTE|nr:hypothetical protein ATETN484_0014013300 [Aspergillus terreus]GFF20799.1 BRCA1 C Terminus (BRCT)-domain-containing protein [Aspergillus terreus]